MHDNIDPVEYGVVIEPLPERVPTEIRRELAGLTREELVDKIVALTEESQKLHRTLDILAIMEDGQ